MQVDCAEDLEYKSSFVIHGLNQHGLPLLCSDSSVFEGELDKHAIAIK